MWAVGASLGYALPVFVVSGLYRAIFRFSGWPAMLAVARAIAVYGLLFAAVFTAIGVDGIPRTVGLIQPLLLLFAVGGSRALARYWLGGMYQSQHRVAAISKALIYGAGTAGRQLASAMANSLDVRVGRLGVSCVGRSSSSSRHGCCWWRSVSMRCMQFIASWRVCSRQLVAIDRAASRFRAG
jgi:FlaA1/EpsC-like NDP-sugar epimerase